MNRFFTKSFNIIKKIKNIGNNNNNNILLGRWETSGKYIDIKSTQANFDCCGDKLCGNPDNLLRFIYKKNT
jgi:hypothetical protein